LVIDTVYTRGVQDDITNVKEGRWLSPGSCAAREWCLQRDGKLEKERPVGGKKLSQIRKEKYEGYYVLEMEQISQQIMRMDGMEWA